ncbi:MAG: TadE/TadG family type IV pilus assembly protein [Xanthobacteraceae bacterium]
MFRTIYSRLSLLRRFVDDNRGVSAIEFAFIAPLMITLYLGGVEISEAVAASRKTTLVAHTVADLVAQVSKVTDADMQDVLSASSAVATPFPAANLTVTVSSIVIDNAGVAKVAWSDTLHGTARTVNSTVVLDAALAVPNTSLILGEVSYSYTPLIGKIITGTMVLSDKTYLRPRVATSVTRSAT